MMVATSYCARCEAIAVPTTASCLAHLRSESQEDYQMEFAVDTILRAEFNCELMDASRREGLRLTIGAANGPYDPFDFSKEAHDLAFRIALG
jgi:hypothetical protein